MTSKKEYNRIYKIGFDNARKEIFEFIENERDNGNLNLRISKDGKMIYDGFSASICLSELIKMLEEK